MVGAGETHRCSPVCSREHRCPCLTVLPTGLLDGLVGLRNQPVTPAQRTWLSSALRVFLCTKLWPINNPDLAGTQQRKRKATQLSCMVRPPKMAVLLLSVPPLLDQCLLHLRPTDLPSYAQSLISKGLHTCPRPQLVIVLIFRSEHLQFDSLSKGQ